MNKLTLKQAEFIIDYELIMKDCFDETMVVHINIMYYTFQVMRRVA